MTKIQSFTIKVDGLGNALGYDEGFDWIDERRERVKRDREQITGEGEIRVGIWNARGTNEEEKLRSLEEAMEMYTLDKLALQETE